MCQASSVEWTKPKDILPLSSAPHHESLHDLPLCGTHLATMIRDRR